MSYWDIVSNLTSECQLPSLIACTLWFTDSGDTVHPVKEGGVEPGGPRCHELVAATSCFRKSKHRQQKQKQRRRILPLIVYIRKLDSMAHRFQALARDCAHEPMRDISDSDHNMELSRFLNSSTPVSLHRAEVTESKPYRISWQRLLPRRNSAMCFT